MCRLVTQRIYKEETEDTDTERHFPSSLAGVFLFIKLYLFLVLRYTKDCRDVGCSTTVAILSVVPVFQDFQGFKVLSQYLQGFISILSQVQLIGSTRASV